MKVKNLFAILAIVSGGLIAGCQKDDFVEIVGECPEVVSTNPANGAADVSLDKIITATFNTRMNPATINQASFTLIGATPIEGTITYTDFTASFTPAGNLTPNTNYTARISTSVKDVTGNALQTNYVWVFRTGTTVSPLVNSTDPSGNETGVALNKVVAATFSTPMDPVTLTETSFTIRQGATLVEGTVTYNGLKAFFTPSENLLSGTTYTATITTGAENVSGTALANNFVWNFSTKVTLGPLAVNLKTVSRFGIIAGTGVSNNAGFSEIHDMDIGISPGVRSSITGFPPGIVVNGAIFASNDIAPAGVTAMLVQAKQELTDAYLFAQAANFPAPATVAGDLGGTTLAPGIYKSTSTLLIQSGDLTLNAHGDADAVWIFQVASGFTTVGGAGGNVILAGGAQAKNVFWQVGSSAIIGDFTSFKGNVLALTDITMNSGATAEGRMLASNGAVVLTSNNIITKP